MNPESTPFKDPVDERRSKEVSSDGEGPAGYFRVPIASLKPGSRLGFRIFVEVGGEPIVFVRTGQVFTRNHFLMLAESRQADVFIAAVDRDIYFRYLQGNIVEILEADFTDPVEQLEQYYGVGDVVTRELLENPTNRSSKELASSWVEHSAKLFVEGPSGVSGALTGMMQVLEVDPDLYQHSMHVCLYGLALAQDLDTFPPRDLTDFGLGLLLHDIGMLDVPEEIRMKSDPLSDEEWAVVEAHPRSGYDKVQGLNWIGGIGRDVILHHHERLDGTGYPAGVAPRDISIAARIAAVVNTFDGRTTNRPYRAAQPSLEVLKEMIDEGRAAYDPKVLATFVRMLSF